MSLCINPNCQNTDNPDNLLHCQSCGSELLLEGCYRVTRPIGQGGSNDEKIKVWNLSNGQEVYTVNGHLDGVNALVFSPDGQILVSGGKDTTIKVWRMH